MTGHCPMTGRYFKPCESNSKGTILLLDFFSLTLLAPAEANLPLPMKTCKYAKNKAELCGKTF